MKIAIYSHSIPPEIDGVSRRFTALINELIKQGHEIVLFTLEDHPEDIPDSVPYYTLMSVCAPFYPDKRLGKSTIVNLGIIMTALLKERPDIIHCVCDGLTMCFGLMGKTMGIPVVTSIHTDVQTICRSVKAPFLAGFLSKVKESLESRLLDGCATTSHSFKRKLEKQGVTCNHVIKTAVDVDTFHPSKACSELRDKLTFGKGSDAILAVCVSRLAPEKRLDRLLPLLSKNPRLHLAIMGDGPLGKDLAGLHGPENRIFCQPGFLSHEDLAQVYASSDVHVSASCFETLGNTVLEAHACGIPVVVPRTQGFEDTVAHDTDGFLFDGDNTTNEASHYLTKIMNDRQLAQRLGQAGRDKVSLQSVDYVVKDMVAWYQDSQHRFLHRRPGSRSLACFQMSLFVVFMIFTWHIYEALVRVTGFLGGYAKIGYEKYKKNFSRKLQKEGPYYLGKECNTPCLA